MNIKIEKNAAHCHSVKVDITLLLFMKQEAVCVTC